MWSLFRSLQGRHKSKARATLDMFLRSMQTPATASSCSSNSQMSLQLLQGTGTSQQGAANCCCSSVLSEMGRKACLRHCAALHGPWHRNRSLAAVLSWDFLSRTAASSAT